MPLLTHLPKTSLILGLCLAAAAIGAHAGNVEDGNRQPDACTEHSLTLPVLEDGDHVLQLQPGQRYLAWVDEAGVDIAVSSDAESGWVDSAPWRWSAEPLLLITDDSGKAMLHVRGLPADEAQQLAIRAVCESGVAPQAIAFWNDARELSRLRTALDEAWQLQSGLKALWVGLRALVFYAEGPEQRAWIQFQMAALARQRGLLTTAADWYQLAADESRSAGKSQWHASALHRRAQALYASGAPGVGALFLEAASAARDSGQLYEAASATQDYCLTLRTTGDTAGAADCLKGQAAEFERIGEPLGQAVALKNQATSLLYLGRYGEAREALQRAERIANELKDERELASLLQIEAQLSNWSGEVETALNQLARSRDLLDQAAPLEQARVDALIGNIYLQSGQSTLARNYDEQAARRFEQLGALRLLGSTRIAIALSYAIDDQLDAALENITSAVTTLRTHGDENRMASALITQARLQIDAGDTGAATQALAELEAMRSRLSWQQQADIHVVELLLADRSNSPLADKDLIDLVDAAQEQGHIFQYLELAGLLATRVRFDGKDEGVTQRLQMAFKIGAAAARRIGSPALRFSILQRLQRIAARPLLQAPDQELLADDAQQILQSMELLRRIDRSTRSAQVKSDAITELERVLADELLSRDVPAGSQERRQLLLRTISEGVAISDVPEVLADPSTFLGTDDALLYFLGDTDQLGFLLWHEGRWHWHRIAHADVFRQAIADLNALLKDGQASHASMDPLVAQLAAGLASDSWSSKATRRIYVVANPDVVALPWSMLPLAGKAATDGEVIGSQPEIRFLQSLQPAASTPVGDVWLLAADQTASSLDSLPALSSELDAVSDAWSGSAQHRIDHVTLPQLEHALEDPNALVHFAAHARGDAGRYEESGLWINGIDKSTVSFVSALRLRQLTARAPVVVLSACETGRSDARLTLGAGGVAGSLVDAGVGAVVASRWPVSDRTAREMSRLFHRAFAHGNTSAASALAAAVNALRSGHATAHPRHWAGWFVLQSGPEDSNHSRVGRAR